MKMLAPQAISLCSWMAPQVGGNMIKVDNMYLKDDNGKLYKVLEIGDIAIKNKQDDSVVQIISGEMLFGDKDRIECIIEDDQIVTMINGEEKKIVIERR